MRKTFMAAFVVVGFLAFLVACVAVFAIVTIGPSMLLVAAITIDALVITVCALGFMLWWVMA